MSVTKCGTALSTSIARTCEAGSALAMPLETLSDQLLGYAQGHLDSTAVAKVGDDIKIIFQVKF